MSDKPPIWETTTERFKRETQLTPENCMKSAYDTQPSPDPSTTLTDEEVYLCWKAYSSLHGKVLLDKLKAEGENELDCRDYVIAKMRNALDKYLELRPAHRTPESVCPYIVTSPGTAEGDGGTSYCSLAAQRSSCAPTQNDNVGELQRREISDVEKVLSILKKELPLLEEYSAELGLQPGEINVDGYCFPKDIAEQIVAALRKPVSGENTNIYGSGAALLETRLDGLRPATARQDSTDTATGLSLLNSDSAPLPRSAGGGYADNSGSAAAPPALDMGAVGPDGLLSREERRQKTCAAPATGQPDELSETLRQALVVCDEFKRELADDMTWWPIVLETERRLKAAMKAPKREYGLEDKLCQAVGFIRALRRQPEFTAAFRQHVEKVLAEIDWPQDNENARRGSDE